MYENDTTALLDVRSALSRLVLAADALNRNDDVVRELSRSGLNIALARAINHAVGVLDATSC